ncbi:MAG: phosphate ABC transporter substrate-binding protein PstS [Thermoplasmata archaeon]|nr:phosphate ABC transporter substrate-binding protein PstS [Thermoplasmata archaeon]
MNGSRVPVAALPSDDIHEAIRIAQGARTQPKVAIVIVAAVAVLVVTGGWLAGWFSPTPAFVTPQTCAGKVALAGAGAVQVAPAMRAWSAEYNTTVCAKVTYSGASTGLEQLASKAVDFAATDTPLSSTQASGLGPRTLVFPVTLEATTVVYNVPGVPSGLDLTGAVLAAIFLGNITMWDSPTIRSLNPTTTLPSGLTITPIYCVGDCGSTLVFTGYLSRSSPAWNGTVGTTAIPAWTSGTPASGSLGMVSAIRTTPGGIGYVELPLAQQGNLSWARLQNLAGSFVSPSAPNTTAAVTAAIPTLPPETGAPPNISFVDEPGTNTYPMATLSYVVVYQDVGAAYGSGLTKNGAEWLGAYLLWITTVAQPLGGPLGYAPLPAVLVTWNQDSLGRLQYYGQNVLAGGDFDGGL